MKDNNWMAMHAASSSPQSWILWTARGRYKTASEDSEEMDVGREGIRYYTVRHFVYAVLY
jgi:hypothetical protein